MDINNLRLEEEFGAGGSKAGTKGAGAAQAPLSLISGVKRPLGVTNRYQRQNSLKENFNRPLFTKTNEHT